MRTDPITSFGDIIGLWTSAEEYGQDVGECGGLARQWKRRDKIPDHKWKATVQAAQRRGFAGVTLELLADLAAEKERKRPASEATVHEAGVQTHA